MGKVIDTQYYWVAVSKRKPRLWQPKSKDDFYDFISKTEEDAIGWCTKTELKYWKPMKVKVELLKEEI